MQYILTTIIINLLLVVVLMWSYCISSHNKIYPTYKDVLSVYECVHAPMHTIFILIAVVLLFVISITIPLQIGI